MFGDRDGIAVKLGYRSGGLIDVDLDDPLAEKLAPEFLPPTDATFGRGKRGASHWFYRLRDGALPKTKEDFDGVPDKDGRALHLIELRADNHFTRLPPSVDGESGETVAWQSCGQPGETTPDELRTAVKRLSAAAILTNDWGLWKGQHHILTLALAGGMHRGGLDPDFIARFIETIARAGGETPDAIADHRRAAESTTAKDPVGTPLTGWKKLAAIIGWPRVTKLIDLLDADPDRRTVLYTSADLHTAGNRTLAALVAANTPPRLFTGPGGAPARIQRTPVSGPVIVPMTDEAMQDEIARDIKIVKPAKEEDAPPDEITTPMPLVKNVLSRADSGLPIVTRILRSPVFAPSGALMAEPGYCPELCAYFDLPADLTLPTSLLVNPGSERIAWARSLIVDDLFGGFMFVAPADLAHAVALLLQPFGRDFIDGSTPIYGIVKPKAGTGGTLLAEAATIPSEGGKRGAVKLSEPKDDGEMRKLILTRAVEGAPTFFLDNLGQRLASPSLAMAVTAGKIADRILQVTKSATVSLDWTWLFTANNPDISDEHARRIAPIRLDAKMERPEERTDFKHKLPGWAAEHRRDLMTAALTLWAGWLQAGRPMGDATLGGFDSWAHVMGGVLNVAGIPGFLANRREFAEEADGDTRVWRAIVAAWVDRYGTQDTPSGLVYDLAPVQAGIVFHAQSEQGKRVAFGRLLKAKVNNRYSEFRIVKGEEDTHTHVPTYRLDPLDGQARQGQARNPWSQDTNPFAEQPNVVRGPWTRGEDERGGAATP